MLRKLVSLILNPETLGVFTGLLIILLIPGFGSKYTLKLDRIEHSEGRRVYFEDLDSDGVSEKIVALENSLGNASYSIYSEEGKIIDQWNFDSDYLSVSRQLFFLDADRDGYVEILHLTSGSDSIFLHYVEPLKENGPTQQKVFIDRMIPANGEFDLLNTEISLYADGKSENGQYLFAVRTGFSAFPRNVYRLDPFTGILEKSPYLTNNAIITHSEDIDGDGRDEIFLGSRGSGNRIDSSLTHRSDYSAWLTVLDDDLEFYFPQIEIPEPFSGVRRVIEFEGHLYGIIQAGGKESSSYLLQLSLSGIDQDTIPLNFNPSVFFPLSGDSFALYDYPEGQVQFFHDPLHMGEFVPLSASSHIDHLDLNGDQVPEWMTIGPQSGEFTVYEEGFKHPVTLDLPDWKIGHVWWGTRKVKEAAPQLWVQSDTKLYLATYSKNPAYALRYVVYLGILGASTGFVWIITAIQKQRERRRRKLEQLITELQLKNIKNQVDPHFVFNSLNAIAEMTLSGNKMETDAYITSFASLMRKTLQSSDRISHSLEEEIDFVKNYVELQKVRFRKNIILEIHIGDRISMDTSIPKYVFFTYVENAIKHGMSVKNEVKINISSMWEDRDLKLIVADNAGGLGSSQLPESEGTGNGMKIMEEIFNLYSRFTKKKIFHSYDNYKDPDTGDDGFRVEIRIAF